MMTANPSLEQRQKIARQQDRAYAALDRAGDREQRAFLDKCRRLAGKQQQTNSAKAGSK
jgi:hypothetical protein